jgi:hypothetical protein
LKVIFFSFIREPAVVWIGVHFWRFLLKLWQVFSLLRCLSLSFGMHLVCLCLIDGLLM